jgi:hypothetical protein
LSSGKGGLTALELRKGRVDSSSAQGREGQKGLTALELRDRWLAALELREGQSEALEPREQRVRSSEVCNPENGGLAKLELREQKVGSSLHSCLLSCPGQDILMCGNFSSVVPESMPNASSAVQDILMCGDSSGIYAYSCCHTGINMWQLFCHPGIFTQAWEFT